eukprot:scaffold557624_cov26-Prasinocladus_malaysianus.AAC.1
MCYSLHFLNVPKMTSVIAQGFALHSCLAVSDINTNAQLIISSYSNNRKLDSSYDVRRHDAM